MITKFNASGKRDLSELFLQTANNLSDLPNTVAAREILGMKGMALIDSPISFPTFIGEAGEPIIVNGKGGSVFGKVGASSKGSFITKPNITAPAGPFLFDGTEYEFTASGATLLDPRATQSLYHWVITGGTITDTIGTSTRVSFNVLQQNTIQTLKCWVTDDQGNESLEAEFDIEVGVVDLPSNPIFSIPSRILVGEIIPISISCNTGGDVNTTYSWDMSLDGGLSWDYGFITNRSLRSTSITFPVDATSVKLRVVVTNLRGSSTFISDPIQVVDQQEDMDSLYIDIDGFSLPMTSYPGTLVSDNVTTFASYLAPRTGAYVDTTKGNVEILDRALVPVTLTDEGSTKTLLKFSSKRSNLFKNGGRVLVQIGKEKIFVDTKGCTEVLPSGTIEKSVYSIPVDFSDRSYLPVVLSVESGYYPLSLSTSVVQSTESLTVNSEIISMIQSGDRILADSEILEIENVVKSIKKKEGLNVVQIACGFSSTMCLKENGDVIGWGDNQYKQVNPSSTTNPWIDKTTVIASGIKQIACGDYHTMLLKENGDVIGWGDNQYKQVNPSSTTNPYIDKTTVIASGIKQIACGDYHTMLLKENGDVIGWGFNPYKQVNPDSSVNPYIDKTTVIASGIKQIACGYYHTMCLKENGDVIGWGRNINRNVNPSSSISPYVDKTTVIVSGIKQIACGSEHTMILKENGDVIGWGNNNYKQVNPSSSTTPWIDKTTVIVSGIKQITCGYYHTMCLKENGDVIGWGNNGKQVNPDSSTTPWIDKTTVIVSGIKQITCGYYHTMCLKENGDVIGWGRNDNKQVNPNSSTTPYIDKTTVITNLNNVLVSEYVLSGFNPPLEVVPSSIYKFSPNPGTSLDLSKDDQNLSTITARSYLDNVMVSGDKAYFNENLVEIANVVKSIKMEEGLNVAQIACGDNYTMILKENGDVIGWGDNSYRKVNPDSAVTPWIDKTAVIVSGVKQIVCGNVSGGHTMCLKENGDVIGWGKNISKQVNPDSSVDPWIDKTAVIVSGVKQIACGNSHTMCLRENGDVIGWGLNNLNQVNPSASVINKNTVIFSGVKQIACCIANTICLKENGDVIGWGQNDYYQTNFNSSTNPSLNTTLVLATKVKQIACGQSHTMCLKENGDVIGWGNNNLRQINPNSTATLWLDPNYIVASGIKQISTYYLRTMCLKENGDVIGWGHNGYNSLNPNSTISPWIDINTVVASEIKQISTGLAHTMCLKENGDVIGWGRNDNKQVNPNSTINPYIDATNAIVNVKKSYFEYKLSGFNPSLGKLDSLAKKGVPKKKLYKGTKLSLDLTKDSQSINLLTARSELDGILVSGNKVFFDDNLVEIAEVVRNIRYKGLDVKQIACGTGNTMCLKENGDVIGWGYNYYGQVNPNSSITPWVDTTTVIASGIKQIDCGSDYTMCLKENGDVIGWGENTYKEINPSSNTNPWIDKTTILVSGIKQISCGTRHTMCLKENGDVIGWGYNYYGQVNPNSSITPWVDTTTVIASGIKQIACSAGSTLCLKENGDVIGWGNNNSKQVNPDSATNPWIDKATIIASGIKQIACGNDYTMCLKENGDVIGWGANNSKQVNPDSATTPYINKTLVIASGIKQIACGDGHTLCLKENGDVIGWGYNQYKQANPSSTISPYIDKNTVIASGIKQIACGNLYSQLLKEDGSLIGFGYNQYKQVNPASSDTIFIGVSVNIDAVPYKEYKLSGFHPAITQVPTNIYESHFSNKSSVSLAKDAQTTELITARSYLDNVMVSGDKAFFDENLIEIANVVKSIKKEEGLNVAQIACSQYFTMCLKENGDVIGWGNNDYKQVNPDSAITPWIDKTYVIASGVKQIECGTYHTMCLKENGDVIGWGKNQYKRVNPDSTIDPWIDKTYVIASGVKQIACGHHTMCLKENGDVIGWGDNSNRNVNPNNSTTPWIDKNTVIASGIKQISCGDSHTMCLKENGDVIGWGGNNNKQVNPDSATTPWIDKNYVIASGIKQVACGGESHTMCLKENGDVIGWGQNNYKQVNPDSATTPWIDKNYVIASGIKQVACGNYHTMCLKENGDVIGWGYNISNNVNPDSAITPWIDKNYVIASGVKQIASGGIYHTMCLKENGDVIGWGDNGSNCIASSVASSWVNKTTVHASLSKPYYEYKLSGFLPALTEVPKFIFDNPRDNISYLDLSKDTQSLANIKARSYLDNILVSGDRAYFDDNIVEIANVVKSIQLDEGLNVAQIACGLYHTMLLKDNGDVIGWGYNNRKQVNPDSAITPWIDKNYVIASGVKQISCGNYHTMCLKENGDVIGWGYNQYKQVNPNSTLDPWIDKTTVIASGIKQISCNTASTICLKENGDVIGWGDNRIKQVNPNSAISPWIDKTVVLTSGIKQIACGYNHTMCLKENGDVIGWGENGYRQANPDSATSPYIDTNVITVSGIKQIACGSAHTMCLKENGDVISFGQNEYKQANPNSSLTTWIDKTVVLTSGIKQIACGYAFTMCLKENGDVVGWGDNRYKQVNSNSAVTPWIDKTVVLTSGIRSIFHGGGNHIMLLKENGDVIGWGYNVYNQVNPDSSVDPWIDKTTILTNLRKNRYHYELSGFIPALTQLPASLKTLQAPISLGLNKTAERGVKATSLDLTGYTQTASQLKGSTKNIREFSVGSKIEVNGQEVTIGAVSIASSDIKQIVNSTMATLVLLYDGSVYGWGDNSYGQLIPSQRVTKPVITEPTLLMTDVSMVGAGTYHTMYLKNNGDVVGCGSNNEDPWSGQRPIDPTIVAGYYTDLTRVIVSGVKYIECGYQSTGIIKNNGDYIAWGMGRGSSLTTIRLSDVKSISEGNWPGYAVKTNGDLYGFNNTNNGTHSSVAQGQVIMSGVKQVCVSDNHTMVVKEDGTLVGWGLNENFRVRPDGTGGSIIYSNDGKDLVLASSVKKVACKGQSNLILKEDGTLVGWGKNDKGQLDPATIGITPNGMITIATGVSDIASFTSNHSVVSKGNTVYSWGDNSKRASHPESTASTYTDKTIKVTEYGVIPIVQISRGWDHTIALLSNGNVIGWGANGSKQVNPASSSSYWNDKTTILASGVKKVACGANYTMCLKTNGDLVGWGQNTAGTVNPSISDPASNPTQVILSDVKDIFVGTNQTFAIKTNGDVYTWGALTGNVNTPYRLAANLTSPLKKAVSDGESFIMFLFEDGTTSIPHITTAAVNQYVGQADGQTGVKDIAANQQAVILLYTDGTVKACGFNLDQQTVPGGSNPSQLVQVVAASVGVKSIVASYRSVACVLNDKTVISWGANSYYQSCPLAQGTYYNSTYIIDRRATPFLSNVKEIANGAYGTAILFEDGTIVGYGKNDNYGVNPGANTTPWTNTSSSFYSPTVTTVLTLTNFSPAITTTTPTSVVSKTSYMLEDSNYQVVFDGASGITGLSNTQGSISPIVIEQQEGQLNFAVVSFKIQLARTNTFIAEVVGGKLIVRDEENNFFKKNDTLVIFRGDTLTRRKVSSIVNSFDSISELYITEITLDGVEADGVVSVELIPFKLYSDMFTDTPSYAETNLSVISLGANTLEFSFEKEEVGTKFGFYMDYDNTDLVEHTVPRVEARLFTLQ